MPFIKQNPVNEMQYALHHLWPRAPLSPWEVHVTTLGVVTPIFIGRCEEMKKKKKKSKKKKETDRWKSQLTSR